MASKSGGLLKGRSNLGVEWSGLMLGVDVRWKRYGGAIAISLGLDA